MMGRGKGESFLSFFKYWNTRHVISMLMKHSAQYYYACAWAFLKTSFQDCSLIWALHPWIRRGKNWMKDSTFISYFVRVVLSSQQGFPLLLYSMKTELLQHLLEAIASKLLIFGNYFFFSFSFTLLPKIMIKMDFWNNTIIFRHNPIFL